jgi:hypothetical protein
MRGYYSPQEEESLQLNNEASILENIDIASQQIANDSTGWKIKTGEIICIVGVLLGSASWCILTRDIPIITIIVITVITLSIISCLWIKSGRLSKECLERDFYWILGIMMLILGTVGILLVYYRVLYCKKITDYEIYTIFVCNITIFFVGCGSSIIKMLEMFFLLSKNIVNVVTTLWILMFGFVLLVAPIFAKYLMYCFCYNKY